MGTWLARKSVRALEPTQLSAMARPGGVFKFPTSPRKAYRTGVVSWSVSHWSTPAPCREMGIYQPWVHPVQRLKVEPEPGRPPGPDVTYQHISGGHQGLEGGEACSRVEVELGRSLPAAVVVEDTACVGIWLNIPQLTHCVVTGGLLGGGCNLSLPDPNQLYLTNPDTNAADQRRPLAAGRTGTAEGG